MRPRPLQIIRLGAALLASFVVAGIVLPRLPLRANPYPRLQWVPRFTVPGDDAFFVVTAGSELSQLVLYHGFGPSIENARKADILFFGNSRMPLGLREEFIVPEAEQLGLRVFSLACGHSEKTRFALDLIRKHDLRPKVVVAVGGPHLFTEGLSEPAKVATEMTRWQAWKEWTERGGEWFLQTWLHSFLPKVDWFGHKLTSRWIIYRSSQTGWWRPVLEPNGRFDVSVSEEPQNFAQLLPVATELREELDARGALLVLSMVPYARTRSDHIPYLARELDVPAVLPSFEGLSLADGSHLNRESAEKYSRAFWDEFIALPEVRRKLSLE